MDASIQDEVILYDKKINFGRKRIILNYNKVTKENFLEVFNKAYPIFESNQKDCQYLIDMYLGKQDILSRAPTNTSNINNKCVVNYTFPITREIVGYTFGNPFDYIAVDGKNAEDIAEINKMCTYEHSYAVDIDTATFASICGIGYQITLPSPDISRDETPEIPVVMATLDPRLTFVVQSTEIGNPQIMSCQVVMDSEGNIVKYTCFTNDYKITMNAAKDKIIFEKNPVYLDPITMVENSLLLTGDWEQAIPIMNALNMLTSDTLNDVEGTIKSLLVILGTDIPDAETTLTNIKDKRLLSLFSGTGGNVDAKFISPQLNSTEVSDLRNFLEEVQNVIVGIPDRTTTGTGGDTGVAVIHRNGWSDIEIVAKLKELLFKRAKQKQLAVLINILKQIDLISDELSVIDISVDISRNTLDNISTRAQTFSTLVATGELATIDALTFAGLTNRPAEVVERGKKEKGENMANAQETIVNNDTTNDTKLDNKNNKVEE
jgi:SPP1 family phage portal protein